MTSAPEKPTVRVTRVTWEADGVVGLTLSAPPGTVLPVWEPGAHIELRLPSGLTRQYSLCGDPRDRDRYTIAVRLEAESRGGSAEVHGTPLIGRELTVTAVKNRFPLGTAEEYLLIAGGIGITPLLPMAVALAARNARWSALYCGRGAQTMAFRDALAAAGGDRVRFVDTANQPRPDVKEAIHRLGPGGVVYCCGPNSLLDSVIEACEAAGIQCETEHFGAATPQPGEAENDDVVELELRRSGLSVAVDGKTTLLRAIRDAGVEIDSDCEEGYCGTCETAVLDGVPDHRDVVLSKTERAAGRTIMPCVSRACGRRLVLDL
ncbi:PDR/VanB family oxidoreductase [Actinoallomurus sp. NBC_01490]|uniref:PDR/VanB family oxidoreductase n=1 Tax=Actinoallomurus sp. NBC_01490 TaxID=2903557 RepID=UPI002E32B35F|nr:PDR/VanB family oxidoreductase [Actinoallomurus sp. NBC_01490]